MAEVISSANEYEDLLGQWSDLESGLGIILSSPDSIQEFNHRVVQYDRWMQGLMNRDPDVGLYLLFQLASNSPVGYSASHALVCATLCHVVAKELSTSVKERDSLVHAALTMNIAMTQLQDALANQVEKPTPAQLAWWLCHEDEVDRRLAGTAYAAMIEKQAPAQRSGVLASLNMVADTLKLLPAEELKPAAEALNPAFQG